MALAPGSRLGPYEIVAPLGAGGMGEVWRAHDARLGRDVAIKVLPGHLASHPELRARFEREARTVSSLNHPNICTLFDVGREGDVDYLVMELVEGGTLADRIAKGPLPTDEALRIGIQVADALDRAHRAGIVHRDLKPGNIMLARTGAKLMDFGLARASALAGATGSATRSPTLTQPLTADGAIVGTFQYMAPEQLDGGEADARADLWALGATLYEMVTGRKAFAGRSQASLIASILKENPEPVSQVQPLAPPALDPVIRACLAKDPDQRLQTAHDVKLQLQWIAEGGSKAGVPAPVAARRRSRESLAWGLAGAALVATIVLGAALAARRADPPRVLRFLVQTPAGSGQPGWPRLSPDGRMLAFLASDSSGTSRIWVRPLDALEAHPLAGTEGAGRPFWSPDSRFLGYIAAGRLYKVPVAGGPPVSLAQTPGGSDGSWGTGGTILFDGAIGDSIRGVPAGGGDARPYTQLDRKSGETNVAWPFFLPDGRHFLYVAYHGSQQDGVIKVGELGSSRTRTVGKTDGRAEYAEPGYVLFPREGTLLAQRFDAGSFKVDGDPVPVGENLAAGAAQGDFSVSPAGLLAFASNRANDEAKLQWFDRAGRLIDDAGPPALYRDVALSPDGSQAVLSIANAGNGRHDLWVRQLAHGVSSRLTFDDGDEISPVWSPDGRRIAYAANPGGVFRTYIRQASGAGDVDSIGPVSRRHSAPSDWSSDGRTLALRVLSDATFWDVWLAPVDRGGPARTFAATPFYESWGVFSPDGRWIAYQSTQSGRSEVYVQAADGSGGKWMISTSGGSKPCWRRDGKELFYQMPDQTIAAVPVQAGATFEAGSPVPLFRASLVGGRYDGRRWAVSADGKRFLVLVASRQAERNTFTVVTAWASELAQR